MTVIVRFLRFDCFFSGHKSTCNEIHTQARPGAASDTPKSHASQYFRAGPPAVEEASPRSAAKQSARQAFRSNSKTSKRPNHPCTADAKEEAASSRDLRLLRCKRLVLLHQSCRPSQALLKSVRFYTRTTKRWQSCRPHQRRPCLRALHLVQRSVHSAQHHRRTTRCPRLLKIQIISRPWPLLGVIRSRR